MMNPQSRRKYTTFKLPRVLSQRLEKNWDTFIIGGQAADFVHYHTSDLLVKLGPCIFFIYLAYMYLKCPVLKPSSWALFLIKFVASTFAIIFGGILTMRCVSYRPRLDVAFFATAALTAYYISSWVLFYLLLQAEVWPGKRVLILLYLPAFLSWIGAQYVTIYVIAGVMCIPEFFVRLLSGRPMGFPSYKYYSRDFLHSTHIASTFRCTQPGGWWCLQCMTEFEEGEKVTRICGGNKPTHVMHLACATRLMARSLPCPVCDHRI